MIIKRDFVKNMYTERGFLPLPSPSVGLAPNTDPVWQIIVDVAADLPNLVANRHFREIAKDLPPFKMGDLRTAWDREYAMRIYSYFASAYVFGAEGEEQDKFIPKAISIPLVGLASSLGRHPILSYSSYCLHNWRRIDHSKPIELENISLVQKIINEYDEDWFILVHVDIEQKGSGVLQAGFDLREGVKDGDLSKIESGLELLIKSLKQINATLARMPEKCDPAVYYRRVRPYIHWFDNIVFESCFYEKPQSYRGETGAQSSLVPCIDAILGVSHKSSILTQHLIDMRNYMPKEHVELIEYFESPIVEFTNSRYFPRALTLRNFLEVKCLGYLQDLYDDAIHELWAFRNQHLTYAIDYIHKKVDDPKGTGGTPFMKWLTQLRDETKMFRFGGHG